MIRSTLLKSARNAAQVVAISTVVTALFFSPLVEPLGYGRATTADLPRIGAILILVGIVSFVVGLIPRDAAGADQR